jgi:hypothetical protein
LKNYGYKERRYEESGGYPWNRSIYTMKGTMNRSLYTMKGTMNRSIHTMKGTMNRSIYIQ